MTAEYISAKVDLIAAAGSFASGGYYEKSDLDLLAIINDRAAGHDAQKP